MRCQWNSGWTFALCCILPWAAHAQANSQEDAAANYAALGQQALAQGRFAEAQTDFEKLEKAAPQVAEVHATLAAICFQQREYDESIREVQIAQKLKPGLPKLDSLLALSLAETGQFVKALPGLEKGFKQTSDAEVRRMCGLQLLRAYTGLGRDPDAVETALALNKLYPDDPEVLYHTGRIYGNYAYMVMEKLHDKAPESIWMLQATGEADESEKNYDGALSAFQQVLEQEPRRPGIHYRLGRVYLRRFEDSQKPDDRTAAAREFAAELEVDPQNGNANYELGVMAYEDGKPEDARRRFEDVLNRFPNFEEALVALAGCDIELSKPNDALAPLERAIELRPNDEVAWYRLAHAQRVAGDKEGAAKSMTEFRRIHQVIPPELRAMSGLDEVTPQKLDADASTQ
ncbi:MAG TPA: tetratricopeptide repeat protein [Terracidiphilus sp.]|nr:tetratricopeptide repeat protein [Terracidiphilus sp.]